MDVDVVEKKAKIDAVARAKRYREKVKADPIKLLDYRQKESERKRLQRKKTKTQEQMAKQRESGRKREAKRRKRKKDLLKLLEKGEIIKALY